MNKLNQRISFLALIFTLIANLATGQYATKDLLTHKVIVSHDHYTVVAYVKPVRTTYPVSTRQYYWFSANQINSTQGGYSGKLLNGSYQEFYLNKNLKESGFFSAGLKTGKWKVWDKTGKLKEEYFWSSGKKNGIYAKYDSLGKVSESGNYRNDLLTGKQRIIAGDSIKMVYYRKGKITERKNLIPKFIRNIFSKTSEANKEK